MLKQKKFSFEDLQPHVDMLCDALENKGASASGVPYNTDVYAQANGYRHLLKKIRDKEITEYDVMMFLSTLRNETLALAGTNQIYRITKIINALDVFVRKEFVKCNENN